MNITIQVWYRPFRQNVTLNKQLSNFKRPLCKFRHRKSLPDLFKKKKKKKKEDLVSLH